MTVDDTPTRGAAERLEWLGATSWRLLGVIALVTIVGIGIAALSGLVIPLVIAGVVGILSVPLVDRLEERGVPRRLAAVGVMTALVAVFVGAFVVAADGIADQSSQIRVQVAAGIDAIGNWLADRDVELTSGQDGYDDIVEFGKQVLPGAASYLSSVFNSVLSFLFGTFLSLFILYYLLADWTPITNWVSRHLGVPARVGASIIDDAASVMRRNFYALTISSLIVAAIIGVTMLILGLPLAFTVTLVTFITAYVPYIGAVVSGTFGFLVALGAGDTTDAIILLLVILVAQNGVQTVVGNKLTSDQLSIHPLPAFLATLVGASVAGLFGAILATPLMALSIAVGVRLRAERGAEHDAGAEARTDTDQLDVPAG
ncbi:AI-2E family transporter [Ilumatobacter sp.]|uniref:AI-2E family transporter n=1 Tax=Ilumatobacter sp. TaxID=1967498 RepID=UPI003AF96238